MIHVKGNGEGISVVINGKEVDIFWTPVMTTSWRSVTWLT